MHGCPSTLIKDDNSLDSCCHIGRVVLGVEGNDSVGCGIEPLILNREYCSSLACGIVRSRFICSVDVAHRG